MTINKSILGIDRPIGGSNYFGKSSSKRKSFEQITKISNK